MIHYTIKSTDLNMPTIKAFGKVWLTSSFIGRILQQDIGKRVYLVRDILQVESAEQYNRRVKQ